MIIMENANLVVERYQLGALEANTYLVYEKTFDKGILIDPADESEEIVRKIKQLDLKQITIFITHGHADHIGGCSYFLKHLKNCQLAISRDDAPMLSSAELNLSAFLGEHFTVRNADIMLKEGDELSLGTHRGTIHEIPGHTVGGLALAFDTVIFTGDTLFAGSIGRSDFPGGDGKQLVTMIKKKIFSLKDRVVLPGHGPETTIEEEKRSNPFVGTMFNV